MAVTAATWFRDRDVTRLVSSPLERAQQTAAPIAEALSLPVSIDDRLIEAGNLFEGLRVGVGDGALRVPRHWWKLRNPFRPSWGEPYVEIATRMLAAVEAARDAARGHEAVLVSHQLPIWTHAAARRGTPVRPRPAPSPVRAGQRHLAGLRGRPLRARGVRRAGRCHRPRRGARRMRRIAAVLLGTVLLAGCTTGDGAVDVANGGEFRFVAATPSGEVIPEADRASAPEFSGTLLETGAGVGVLEARRPGRRPQLLGLLVRAVPGGDAGVQRGVRPTTPPRASSSSAST